MTVKERFELFKEWYKLVKQSITELDTVNNLRIKLTSADERIFKEKIQPTNGFFIGKPTPFIEPYVSDWGITLPCTLTIYRNAIEDNVWEDGIVNVGTEDDVKEFQCPLYTTKSKCTKSACPYNVYNHQHFDLPTEIETAEATHKTTVAERQVAWKQIWTRGK